nr:MAG TPA: tail tube protein [Caudoviricetes sp.]
MAQFGAKRPRFAPVATTPDNALPTYNFESVVTIGKLVAANLTVTNASGELYGDDALAEKIDMFASGSMELQTDDKTAEVHAALHGATLDELEEELTDSDSDVAPRGGLAYYKVLIRNGVRVYQGVFHPLVNAILGNDSAATKGNSITFGTSTTTFTVFRCNSGAWRIRKEFSSEADVIAWCDEKLGDTGT